MERINKGFSSLVSCYALLATLACSFLIYAHWAFTAHPPQWADQVGSFVTRPSSGHTLHLAKALAAIRVAALYFHERAHTTRLYFGVFSAVWLACLLWTLISKRRRVAIYGRGTVWIGAMSLLVLAVAALYGIGTHSVFSRRIPALPHVSDAIAAGFLLALPLITWSRTRRRADDEDLDGEGGNTSEVSAHRLARLGFRNEISSPISVVPPHDGPAPREISSEGRPVLVPSQNSQAEDHAMIAANRLIARAAAPVIPEPHQVAFVSSEPEAAALPKPVPAVAIATSLALMPTESVTATAPEPVALELADQMAGRIAEAAALVFLEPADTNSPEPISEIAAHTFTSEMPEPSAEFPLELAAVELAEPLAVSEPAAFIQAESPAPIAAHLVAAQPPVPEASLQPGTTASVYAEPITNALEESTEESGAQTHFRQMTEPVCGVAAHLAAIVVPTAVPETPEYPGVLQNAAFQTPEPVPSEPTQPPPQAPQPTAAAEDHEAPNGAGTFRHDLLGLYRSWQRIETMQGEIDGWFEDRRRQAVAHVATPPAMRTSGLGRDLVRDFPTNKMNAIESEWAEIRNLALEISRSVGELPDSDHDR